MCKNFIQSLMGAKPASSTYAPPAAAVSGATGEEQSGTLVGEASGSVGQSDMPKPKKKRVGTVVGLSI